MKNKKISDAVKKSWKNPESRARMIQAGKDSWTPELRKRKSEYIKSLWKTPRYRNLRIKQQRDRFKSRKTRKKVLNWVRKGQLSRLKGFHKLLLPILTKVGYLTEYPIGPYLVDFALIENNVVIEIDGVTHLRKQFKRLDKIRDKYLHKHGWKVIRVREGAWTKKKSKIEKVVWPPERD